VNFDGSTVLSQQKLIGLGPISFLSRLLISSGSVRADDDDEAFANADGLLVVNEPREYVLKNGRRTAHFFSSLLMHAQENFVCLRPVQNDGAKKMRRSLFGL